MNLNEKIEEIRQKPEHIRIRYVWGAVSISMLIIIIVWIFSFQNSLGKKDSYDSGNETFSEKLQQNIEEKEILNEPSPSIRDLNKEFEETSTEGVLKNKNASNTSNNGNF